MRPLARLVLAPASAAAAVGLQQSQLLLASPQGLFFSTAAASAPPPPPPAQPAITSPTTLKAQPQDWSITMKKAAEVSALEVTKAADKEVGYCTGIPPETYNRVVRACVRWWVEDLAINLLRASALAVHR